MSEEKNRSHMMTVAVEYDGEQRGTYEGHAIVVVVAGDEGCESYMGGNLSTGEAMTAMEAMARQIGAMAHGKGLSERVAMAVAEDGIVKQMKKESFSDMLTHLDAALEKCEECQESDSKES